MNPFFILFESKKPEEIEELMVKILDRFLEMGVICTENYQYGDNHISDFILNNERILTLLESFQRKISERFYTSYMHKLDKYFVSD